MRQRHLHAQQKRQAALPFDGDMLVTMLRNSLYQHMSNTFLYMDGYETL